MIDVYYELYDELSSHRRVVYTDYCKHYSSPIFHIEYHAPLVKHAFISKGIG